MGRINNTDKYPVDTNISLNENLIGSDDDGKTKNYKVGSLLNLLGGDGTGSSFNYSYRYTDGEGDTTANDEGYFEVRTDPIGTDTLSEVIRITANKTNLNGSDLSGFFDTLIDNEQTVLIKISDGTNVNFGYYAVNTLSRDVQNNDVYIISLFPIGTVQVGSLIDEDQYLFSFDVSRHLQDLPIPKTLEILDAEETVNIDLSIYTERSKVNLNFINNGNITFSNIPEEGTTLSIVITTADGSQTVGLPSTPEYNYFGELDFSKRNKVVLEFANYDSLGLQVDVFQNVSNVVLPTISFNVSNTNIEIGSNFSETIVISFTPNNAGAIISRSLEKDGTEISNTETTAFSETNVVSQFTLQAFASYAAGQGVSAGTISTALRNITPRYKYWTHSGNTGLSPDTSSTVRALTDNGLITGQTIQATIPQGDTEFSIYIPDTESLSSVLYVESSNADITANFSERIITVNDAGGTPRSYKKLTQIIGGTGYTAEATYLITLQ